MHIAEHVYLDVPSAPQVLLDIEPIIVKRLTHLALRCGEDVTKPPWSMHQPDAAPPASRRGLEHKREANVCRVCLTLTDAAQHICAWKHGKPSLPHRDTCLYLVTHLHHRGRGR